MTWFIGYSYMTKEKLIQNTPEKEFLDCFAKATTMRVEGNTCRDFSLSSVSNHTTIAYTVTRKFKGYTKSAYRRRFTFFPEKLNHKPCEILDEHGDP